MLEPAERKALEERIRAQPGHFVAQYPVTPSLSPKWDGNDLVPAAMVMRVFVSAEGDCLSRAAGRPGARAGGRHLPALARPPERHAEGRLGAGRGRRRRAGPARRGASTRSPSSAAAPTCKAASPTISTGSAATSSASTTTPACCAPRRPRWRPGAVSPRDAVELRLLGRLLNQANLMDQASALSAPENAAFQQGLAAVADRRSRPDRPCSTPSSG